MSRSASVQMNLTKHIKHPNRYIQALYKEYKHWAFDEPSAEALKGQWRENFLKSESTPLHLEIGPGNGKHFAQLCLKRPEHCFLSMELKYKPLIQTIKRVRKNKSTNAKIIRYNARLLDRIFEQEELNNVYIHFPDPWLKKKSQKKHQMIQEDFCKKLFKLQKPNSFLEFKTDSKSYFLQSLKFFKQAGYILQKQTSDLYKTKTRNEREATSTQHKNFKEQLSQFELIFFQKNLPIHYALLIRSSKKLI